MSFVKLKNSCLRLARFLGPQGRRYMVYAMLASLLLLASEVAVATVLQLFLASIKIVDPALLPEKIRALSQLPLWVMCLGLATIGAIRAYSMFASQFAAMALWEDVNSRMKLLGAYNMLIAETPKFSIAQINRGIAEDFHKAGLFFRDVSILTVSVFQAAAMLVTLFWIAWPEALLALLCSVLMGVLLKLISRKLAQASKIAPNDQEDIVRSIQRVARNSLYIRISRTQLKEYLPFVGKISSYHSTLLRSHFYINIARVFPIFVGTLLIAIIVGFNQTMGSIRGPALLSFIYLFVRFVQQMSVSVNYYGYTKSYMEQVKFCLRIFEAFTPQQRDFAFEPKRTEKALEGSLDWVESAKAPKIEASHLAFSWQGSEEKVFEALSVRVGEGQALGIRGPSGSGKTTLLMNILGLLRPTNGSLKIDGLDPPEYFSRYSSRVGYVGPEPLLVEGSIRENVIYGLNREVDDSEIWEALQMAALKSTVSSLPLQLDYRLSEDTSGLSMGQKQRLSLARALLRRPVVLILDEASANLDVATERELVQTLVPLKGKMTTIAVSHRDDFLAFCDQILPMGNHS